MTQVLDFPYVQQRPILLETDRDTFLQRAGGLSIQ
jgi:hypothetical protein